MGRKPKGFINPAPYPLGTQYIITMYQKVSGFAPLTYTEIKSWSELTCTPLSPIEVEALIALDRLFWSKNYVS